MVSRVRLPHGTLGDGLAAAAATVKKDVRRLKQKAGRLTRNQIEHVADEVQALRGQAHRTIRAQPIRSVLIAAAAGAVLGFFLRRR